VIRIIDGFAYQSQSADHFVVKAHDLGNGHLEVVAMQGRELVELDWSPRKVAQYLRNKDQWPDHTEEEIRERNRKRAAIRAKSNVRRLCKVAALDTLLTLTYRANQTDLSICKKHLKEFVRRLRTYWPEFLAVAAFEQQERGAWHVHLAVKGVPREMVHRLGVKVKSFNMIRAIWRSVVGQDNGNIDIAKRKGNSKKSPAKLAAYLSKYIMKAFQDGDDHVNRWTKFGQIPLPKPFHVGYCRNMIQAIEFAYSFGSQGDTVTSYLNSFGDLGFFVFENLDVKKPSIGGLTVS
jgi:hypothetical protein